MKKLFTSCLLFLFILLTFIVSPSASADHSWENYHWARTSNPFSLKLADNLTPNWDSYLSTSSTDWTVSSVLNTTIVSGTVNPKRCPGTTGQVNVCNASYGKNGWLGIAQVWISGSHITQGAVKLNDSYFSTVKYNTPAWKNLVMCQEVGHTFGLDHQDEDFGNTPLGTCMDYSNDATPNQHPNAHDYAELEDIYAHLDSINTVNLIIAGKANGEFNSRSEWGRLVRDNGHVAVFERKLNNKDKVVTHVLWAQE